MKEADEAAAALRKLQETAAKYADIELGPDELTASIKDRINASEDLKAILKKATEAKAERDKSAYHQWRASD